MRTFPKFEIYVNIFFRYFLRSLKSSCFGEMVRCLISSRKNILIGNLIEIIFFLLCTLFYIVNFLQWNFEYWLDNKMDIYKRMFLKFQMLKRISYKGFPVLHHESSIQKFHFIFVISCKGFWRKTLPRLFWFRRFYHQSSTFICNQRISPEIFVRMFIGVFTEWKLLHFRFLRKW